MSLDSRVCPACGIRNKVKWEYCVRCGELLTDVPVVEVASAIGPVGGGAEPRSSPLATSLQFVILVGLGVYAWGWWREPPSRPSPDLFTFPTVEYAPSPATPAGEDAAEEAYQAAHGLLRRGEAARAVEILARAVAEAPDNALYRSALGKALVASGAPEEGERQLEEAFRLDPSNVSYVRDLSRALEQAGRMDDAARACEQGLAAQPGHTTLVDELAHLHLRAGRFDQAVPLLSRLAEASPDDLTLQQDLGRALEMSGNTVEAADQYRQILDRLPEATITRGLLAEVLFNEGRGEEAVALFREGLEHQAGNPLLNRGLASLLERSGHAKEAVAAYREYAALAPNAPDAKDLAARADALESRLVRVASGP